MMREHTIVLNTSRKKWYGKMMDRWVISIKQKNQIMEKLYYIGKKGQKECGKMHQKFSKTIVHLFTD